MPSSKSRILYPDPGFVDPSLLTGRIGYLDFIVVSSVLPIVVYMEEVDSEIVDTLNIKTIGIEPRYREKGHARSLVEITEDIARQRGLVAVVVDGPNDNARNLFEHLGYDITFGGPFKRL